MKINWLVLSTAAMFFACNVYAQNPIGEQVKEARIKMLAAAVSFLTVDSVFKVKYADCNCKTKAEVYNFIKTNKLTQADAYVTRLDSSLKIDSSANWNTGLENFRKGIEDVFFHGPDKDGKNDKSYRRTKYKKEYDEYDKKMQAAIADVKPPVGATGDADKDKTSPNKKNKTGTYQAENIKPDPDPPLVTPLFLYIVIGALAVAIGYLLLSQRKGRRNKNNALLENHKIQKEQIEDLQTAVTEKNKKIKALNKELSDLKEEHERVNRQMKMMENLIEKNKGLKKEKAADITDMAKAVAANGGQKHQQSPNVARPPEIRYAHYADGGNGFLEGSLQEQPDNETIFEITITSADSATFVVSGNSTVQRYAISNTDYFLSKACKYDSFPSYQPNGIFTDTPGRLRKENSKWIIEAPAEISFS
jgi:hypothetical protein